MTHLSARLWFFLACWLAASCTASATSALAFEGAGYWVDMEIGDDRALAIASVRFHRADDPAGVVLPRSEWVVEAFDPQRQVLILRHDRGGSGVPAFLLSVRHRRAVLAIGGREIRSTFSWAL